MTGTRRVAFAGLLVLATVATGCGGTKHAAPTTTTTTVDPAATTTTTLTPRDLCAQLVARTRVLRTDEAPITRELAAAQAVDPHSEATLTLKSQQSQLQRELDDVGSLIARIEAANGRSACPSA
jgi:hypothetical protein